jgi:hypothetical protein
VIYFLSFFLNKQAGAKLVALMEKKIFISEKINMVNLEENPLKFKRERESELCNIIRF